MKRIPIQNIEEWNSQGVLSVMGPTGSGKSSTVVSFLRNLPEGESDKYLLVSVDSVAFYRGLDIGSAKVLREDRKDFSWIGLDFLDPNEPASTKQFLEEVETPILDHLNKSLPVILVGGSGFYEQALVDGLAPGAKSDPQFQKELEAFSNEELHERLLKFDKNWGEKIFPNDRYRVTRYLDLVERQGFSRKELYGVRIRNADLRQIWNETYSLVLKPEIPKSEFKGPLENRIEEMMSQGWLDEVKELLKTWKPEDPGMQSMGYKEIVSYLENQIDLTECKEQILNAHLYYVKRQKTWFRKFTVKESQH